ncbi:hypothetical protein GY03_07030 [Proteus vulgaris]|uniref:hypothetical protein n=1 Tax=Proteus vulgaris TaxID=585 RepID=UPI0021B0F8B8|nr:hypothetical protein [Proteus vulgaris]MCT6517024.1 hypothetical protein [Proteus vulgaris]
MEIIPALLAKKRFVKFNVLILRIVMKYLLLMSVFSFNALANQECNDISSMSGASASFTYKKAIITSSERVYFYSAPDNKCQLEPFLIKNDIIEVFRNSSDGISGDNWFYVRYKNDNNEFFTGWIKSTNASYLNNEIRNSGICSFNKENLNQYFKLPDKYNHYTVISKKAWLYSYPDTSCRSSNLFLIHGDSISAQGEQYGEFILVNYYDKDGDIIRGWIKINELEKSNNGDIYRNDISALDTDLAVRVVSLWLSNENKCYFYEDSNDGSIYRLLVHEDHYSSNCRGGADPQTAPVVAWFDIDKKTGNIDLDGINKAFE